MKTLTRLILAVVLAAGVVTSNFAAKTNQIFLTWDMAPDWDSGVTFVLYSQTNLALPASGWLVATNISWDRFVTSNYKVPIPAASDLPVFYTVTASNVAGESGFSLPIDVRLPSVGRNLRVGKF